MVKSSYFRLQRFSFINTKRKWYSYIGTYMFALSSRDFKLNAYVVTKYRFSRAGKFTFYIKARASQRNFLLQRSSSLKFESALKGETRKEITGKRAAYSPKSSRLIASSDLP